MDTPRQDLSVVKAAMQQVAVPLDVAKVEEVLGGVPEAISKAKHTGDGWYRVIVWDVSDQFQDRPGMDVWLKLTDMEDQRYWWWVPATIRAVLKALGDMDLGEDIEFGAWLWQEQVTGLTGRWLVVLQFRCKPPMCDAKPDAVAVKAAMQARAVPLDEAKVQEVLSGVPEAVSKAKHVGDGWYRAIVWDVTDQKRTDRVPDWLQLSDVEGNEKKWWWISATIRAVMKGLGDMELGQDTAFGVRLWLEQDVGLTGRWLLTLQFRCGQPACDAKPDPEATKAAMLKRHDA